MNASIYVYRPEYLLKAKKLFDGNLVGFYMKDTAVLDIDSQEDKELMEVMARYLRSSGKWKKDSVFFVTVLLLTAYSQENPSFLK